MPGSRDVRQEAVVEFLRREAPLELERLESLARVVGTGVRHRSGVAPRDPYWRWLLDSDERLHAHRDIGGAA